MLILAGVTISVLSENGIFAKAQQAAEKAKYVDAKENLQLMLFGIKTRVITEEKRNTSIMDCDELEGEEGITKIKYESEGSLEYAFVTYRDYIFKVDDELNIIEDEKQEGILDDIIAGGGKYIYNRGQISEEAKSFIGLNDVNSEYAINSGELYMNIIQSGNNNVFLGTERKINLANYTKIKCLVSTGEGLPLAGNCFYLTLVNKQISNINEVESISYKSKIIGANETECILEFEIPDEYFDKEGYVGIVGVLKDIHVYKIWLEKSETKVLYDHGNISQEVNGFIGTNDVNSEYAINAENLFMTTKAGYGNNLSYIGTENKINLTGYRKIRCLVSTGDITQGYSGNFFGMAILDMQYVLNGPMYRQSRKIGANQTQYNLSFEIPDECRNDSYYIGVNGCLQNVYVYKIWLEK